MKTLMISLVLVTAFVTGLYASNEEFPRIGATYRVVYPALSEGTSLPSTVMIVSKGSDAWYLVEYERRGFTHVKGKIIPVPSDSKPRRTWINFDVIVTAMEQEVAEPDDAENGGKPLSDKRTP